MSEYEAWQSFLIKELNMHGQIKSTTAYSGNYVFNSISGEDVTGSSVISQESIEYYDPVKGIPVLDNLDQLETINDWDDLPLKKLGKETEIIRESRFVGETGISTTFEFDVAVGYIPPVEFIGPQFGFACSGSQSLSEMKSYTKTTYITYPVIQKKIISVRDNMRLVSENVAFDKYSGKPIITLTNDGHHALEIAGVEHDGDILNINIPASYYYDQMRQAATNEKLILTSTPERKLFITNVNNKYYLNISSLNQNDLPKYCTGLGVGDLVEIKAVDFPDTTALCHIANVYGNCYKLAETYYSATGNNLALLNGLDVDVRVIRSGCTNQLNLPADNIAIYGHQIPQLSIDEITISGSPMLALANTLNSSNSVQISSISGLDTLLSYPLQSFIVVDIVDNTKSITIKNNNEILCSNILFEPDLFLGGTGTGQFQVDENTGQIVYYSVNNPANPQEIPCLTMSNIIPRTVAISNILSAGANTYSDYWPYNAAIYPGYSQTNAFNNFEKGVRGKCRQNAAYIYNKDATGVISDQNMKNYTTGLFDLVLFNWEYPSANNPEKWLKSVQINKYSPNGNALEEENILHIKSAAKFGYHQALPYLVAANCPYHLCLFESFENQYQYGSNTYFEDGLLYANGSINNDISHSGSSSFNLAPHQFFKLLTIPSSDFSLLETKGFNCMVWVYSLNNNIEPPNLMISEDGDYVASLQMKQSAKIGYWRLYEGTLKTNVSGNEVSIGIEHNNNSLIIDDIRIQPSDAQVNTYVYDVNTHKLITSFDAQHFGLFYQYDAKGQLVRKQKETVRGVKTLQEAEYNNGYKVERSSL
ncbi:MAG: hypothetical protein HY738_17660 [Bacteroidia bacterium]|nr:hypothetical protein [Bacteroidia bacterium]